MRVWLVVAAVVGIWGPRVVHAERAERVELTFVGDIMFGGLFDNQWRAYRAGFDPLAAIAPALASDLAVGNLETTVVSAVPVLKGTLRFAALPAEVAYLRDRIGAVTLANNHATDLDGLGLRETPRHVRAAGIVALGAATPGEPTFRVETVEVRGWRVGFLAATTRLNRKHRSADPHVPHLRTRHLVKRLGPIVKAARADHDLVIVTLHWGDEFVAAPEDRLIRAGRALIDLGADAVIGHHPHVLQPIERYKGGVIAYSLGNFVFPNALPGPRRTGVLRLGWDRSRCLARVTFHPAVMAMKPAHHPVSATRGRDLRDIARATKLRLAADRTTLDSLRECP